MSPARRSLPADSNGSSRGDSACGGTERDRSPVALHFQSLNTAKEQPKEQPKFGRPDMGGPAASRWCCSESRSPAASKIAAKFKVGGGVAHG
jgi:hypothetical protein